MIPFLFKKTKAFYLRTTSVSFSKHFAMVLIHFQRLFKILLILIVIVFVYAKKYTHLAVVLYVQFSNHSYHLKVILLQKYNFLKNDLFFRKGLENTFFRALENETDICT